VRDVSFPMLLAITAKPQPEFPGTIYSKARIYQLSGSHYELIKTRTSLNNDGTITLSIMVRPSVSSLGFVVFVPGEALSNITHNPNEDRNPLWTGNKIVFLSRRGTAGSGFQILSMDSTGAG